MIEQGQHFGFAVDWREQDVSHDRDIVHRDERNERTCLLAQGVDEIRLGCGVERRLVHVANTGYVLRSLWSDDEGHLSVLPFPIW